MVGIGKIFTNASLSEAIVQRSASRRNFSAFSVQRSAFAFTLTELLVVISIIVLMLGLAVPVLKVLGGGASIGAAENQIAAILGRARTQAVADRTIAGAFFYLDPKDSRVRAVIVEESPAGIQSELQYAISLLPAGTPKNTIALDLASDVLSTGTVMTGNVASDAFVLPAGTGVQFLDSCHVNYGTTPPTREDDGYIGFNTRNQFNAAASPRTYDTTTNPQIHGVKYGGVVLFDSSGKLTCTPWVLDVLQADPNIARKFDFTLLGQVLFGATPYDYATNGNFQLLTQSNSQFVSPMPLSYPRDSQYGLVVFDYDAFKAQGYTDEDAEVEVTGIAGSANPENTIEAFYQAKWPSSGNYPPDTANAPSEQAEENWLDQNATPLIINRYDGSLIRGQ